jgi:two-component system NtrC family sensor kinase
MFKFIKQRLGSFYHSISFRLFLLLFFLLIFLFGGYSTICSMMQQNIFETTVGQSAYRASDLIKKSLYRLMLSNEREELYYTILTIGDEPGITRIRIYNKKGEIKFSTNENETGKIVDMKAEACYGCHSENQPIESLTTQQKTRIYRSSENERVLGLINPIRNSRDCTSSTCHYHSQDQTILGVLDVQMSLADLDAALMRNRLTIFIISIIVVAITIVLFAIVVFQVVHRPIHKLQTGTLRLAVGDLSYRINMSGKNEFSMLARSFNNMAENLKTAYTELKDWSERLAERVEQKTAELENVHKSMLHVEKMTSLGKMAASVAHELNNPIAGIVTYARLLEKKISKQLSPSKDRDKIMSELELIRSESLRCGNIVRNLLAFARGTSPNFEKFDLEKLVEKGLQIVNHHMELAGVTVEKKFRLIEPEIEGDPDQILQALIALFVNAVEAMPTGGKLDVVAETIIPEENEVIIKIQDTGIGIPEDIRDKIFEPFFSTKKEKKGVGLGLPVVYGIVQRHKGKIWVESRPQEGATFFIRIPVMQQINQTSESEE